MDKLLLTAIISAFAALLTAALSIVKLVSDKEGKTTDYRQAWTESARAAFAELITAINAQAATIKNEAISRHRLTNATIEESNEPNPINSFKLNFIKDRLSEHQKAFLDQRKTIYSAFATLSLHFKNEDPHFLVFSDKFRAAEALLNKMKDTKKDKKQDKLKLKIHSNAEELSVLARSMLKQEWETIKKGETAYQQIKRWSGWACTILFIFIISLASSTAFPAP